ncbi:unnamed protein product, partial [Brassica rapa subsp. trilocularis]
CNLLLLFNSLCGDGREGCKSGFGETLETGERGEIFGVETMKSDWFNLHQIARNSFIATSTLYASTELNFDRRSFCFFAPDRSGFVVLKSEKEFNNALSKARDGSLPSVFYFTAAWCGPCKFIYFSETKFRFWIGFLLICGLLGRLIAPVMLELGKKYPHVTTYKVDIDEVCLHLHISHHCCAL